MQRMREHVGGGVAPGHELAVVPDVARRGRPWVPPAELPAAGLCWRAVNFMPGPGPNEPIDPVTGTRRWTASRHARLHPRRGARELRARGRGAGAVRARVSEAVAGLERALGARLLHRTTRRLALSDDGRAFYSAARDPRRRRRGGGAGRAPGARCHAAGCASTCRWRWRACSSSRRCRALAGIRCSLKRAWRPVIAGRRGVDCAISYGPPADTELVAGDRHHPPGDLRGALVPGAPPGAARARGAGAPQRDRLPGAGHGAPRRLGARARGERRTTGRPATWPSTRWRRAWTRHRRGSGSRRCCPRWPTARSSPARWRPCCSTGRSRVRRCTRLPAQPAAVGAHPRLRRLRDRRLRRGRRRLAGHRRLRAEKASPPPDVASPRAARLSRPAIQNKMVERKRSRGVERRGNPCWHAPNKGKLSGSSR